MIRKTAIGAFLKRSCATTSSSNPAAGRNGQGARTIGRMDAIRNLKTMAGSPGAEAANSSQSASGNLAHGFCVLRTPCFRETMKEDRNVQYSFRRNRLGW